MINKKELKDSYKEKKFQIGVFQIRNTVNQKILLESSTDLNAIWNRHQFQLNAGLHPNRELQKEWLEFGRDKFVFEIISEVKQDDKRSPEDFRREAKQLEAMFLEELKPFGEKGYHGN